MLITSDNQTYLLITNPYLVIDKRLCLSRMINKNRSALDDLQQFAEYKDARLPPPGRSQGLQQSSLAEDFQDPPRSLRGYLNIASKLAERKIGDSNNASNARTPYCE